MSKVLLIEGLSVHKYILLIFILSLNSAHAADDDSVFKNLGFGPTIFSFSPEDPDGPTDSEFSFSLFNVFYLMDLGRDTRLFTNLSYIDYSVSASTSNIAQDVSRYSIATVYQTRFRPSRNFKPWLGIGLSFSSEEFTKRYTVDSDGFLLQSYKDRSDSGVALELDFTNDVTLFDTDLVFRIGFTSSLYDGSSGFQSNLIWFY